MKTELIIANKSVGKMWEISNSVPEVTWSTERTGSPGTLKFNVLKGQSAQSQPKTIVNVQLHLSFSFPIHSACI